jgi:putative tryptophan/tyrosine transport system substrate-binding protein
MNRRQVIAGLGSAAAWPVLARAQQQSMPVIGVLRSGLSNAYPGLTEAFLNGVNETGLSLGRDFAVQYRFAEGRYDRLSEIVIDLLRQHPILIYASDNPAALALKASNANVSVVFAIGGDPLKLGLVNNLNRPGGNVTGVSFLSTTTVAISIQMLRQAAPNSTVIAVLVNPGNPNADEDIKEAGRAAHNLGLSMRVLRATSEAEIDQAIADIAQVPPVALYINGDAFFTSEVDRLVALTARHAIPALYQRREFALAGGLMSYGTSILDANRLAGGYAGRILHGEKPANLPVQQSVKVELILNLKTARALGVTFPATLLARADEVIE